MNLSTSTQASIDAASHCSRLLESLRGGLPRPRPRCRSAVLVQSFLSDRSQSTLTSAATVSALAQPPQPSGSSVRPPPPLDPLEAELGWRTGIGKTYSIGAVIGVGTHGKVCVGRDRKSGQEVAIKIMAKVRGKQPRSSVLQAVEREADMLRRVQQCSGVAGLVDCYEDVNSVQIVTEYCRGGDMRRHVETRGPLDEAALAGVAREVMEALQMCHQQGVVYADVKPSNICKAMPVGGPQNLRLVDFGCAQTLGQQQRATKRTGTLAFMSPETFGKSFSFKSDVWSVGITLYWLYSYQLPYWSNADTPRRPKVEDVAAVVQSAPISFDYGPWKNLSVDGLDFISSCLTRDETQRPSAAQALEHPWIRRTKKERLAMSRT